MDYASSPCAVCGVDRHGKKRRNNSREGGHGRVVSLEQIERYLSDELPEENVGTEEEQPREKEAVLDFIGVFCRMGIHQQFLVEQRFFFGRPLEKIAADYRQRFRRPMTAAGVSVAVEAAKSRIAPALRPVPTKA